LIRTVRHLRPVQITNRLSRRLLRVAVPSGPLPPCRGVVAPWVEGAERSQSLLAANRIDLIGRSADISSTGIWRDPGMPKLWLYQLHYFDDLNATGAASRIGWHRALMDRWLAENPPGSAIAWDPYPISLRVVNWIKWQVAGTGKLTAHDLSSLAHQVRYLLPRLEHHLLGNHLLENYKTLLIAGCFFASQEADAWRERGLRGMHVQLEDQLRADGAHNELAPMYQGILTEGVLDSINFLRVFGLAVPAWLEDAAARMVGWGLSVAHPDGDWPQFNDTALDTAPRPGALAAYLSRMGLEARIPPPSLDAAFVREARGYWTLIADLGGLGPDHNPGHGHADNLTYELSMGPRRVVVDTGISTYEVDDARARERSTAAHNTLEVEGCNSSEVWESFRVGRRAHTKRIVSGGEQGGVLAAAHDGYCHLPGSPVHMREWRWGDHALTIVDEIRSGSSHKLSTRIHLHPHYNVARHEGSRLVVLEGDRAIAHINAGNWTQLSISDYQFAPRFGCLQDAKCIVLSARSSATTRFSYTIEGI